MALVLQIVLRSIGRLCRRSRLDYTLGLISSLIWAKFGGVRRKVEGKSKPAKPRGNRLVQNRELPDPVSMAGVERPNGNPDFSRRRNQRLIIRGAEGSGGEDVNLQSCWRSPHERYQTIPDFVLVLRIPHQVLGKKSLLIKEPPYDPRDARYKQEESPPR